MQKLKQYKICRRLGTAIFEKCQTQKFARTMSEQKERRAVSTYGKQLLEKQKIRYSYGLREKQLANYAEAALKAGGNPAENLFQKLEMRLDNVVYRFGLAKTRRQARQIINHGHFLVNGRKVKVPSIILKIGDVITIRPESQNRAIFANLDKKLREHRLPSWLEFDMNNRVGRVRAKPPLELALDLGSVLEFYSR